MGRNGYAAVSRWDEATGFGESLTSRDKHRGITGTHFAQIQSYQDQTLSYTGSATTPNTRVQVAIDSGSGYYYLVGGTELPAAQAR